MCSTIGLICTRLLEATVIVVPLNFLVQKSLLEHIQKRVQRQGGNVLVAVKGSHQKLLDSHTVVCNVKASWRACHMQDTLIETEMDHNCMILCPGNCSE